MTTLKREMVQGVELSQLKILQIRDLEWTMCPQHQLLSSTVVESGTNSKTEQRGMNEHKAQ